MNTVETCNIKNCDRSEKEGSNGMAPASRVLKISKLNGHEYKQWLKSKGIKAKGSDLSMEKRNGLSRSEVNAAEINSLHNDDNVNTDDYGSHPQEESLNFTLQRVKAADHAKENNDPNDFTQTTDNLEKNNDNPETPSNMDKLEVEKESESCIAHMPKSTKPKFVEYWVPVRLSEVQTELYCGTLFSNAGILSSHSKDESWREVLNGMLVWTRKCCDHPYLVDRSLSTSLITDVSMPELMDAEIKLSSKLLLLHKILLEIRKRGLRVLILYQSHGGSRSFSIGDLLDEIIHEKFGSDLYERIGGRRRVPTSIRRAALNTFNDKTNGKFICLMETGSCTPSIKLAFVETVIFFNSNWNPATDMKSLQKIDLTSQLDHVKVFRLYSSHTLEEKLLILAKQGITPKGVVEDFKQRMCHQLLTWGASHLFERLDEFHNTPDGDSSTSSEDLLGVVFLELSSLLPDNENTSICRNETSLITEVRQVEGTYLENISLLGELENPQEMIPQKPHLLWKTLLKGRNPKWKYFSCQSRRTSKMAKRFYDVLEEASDQTEPAPRKHKKVAIAVKSFDDLFEPSSGTESAPRKRRRKMRTTVYQIPTNIKRKIRSKLQNQGGGKFSSVNNDVKSASATNRKRRKVSTRVSDQSPLLSSTPPSEHHSLPPADEHRTTQNNGHCHGTAARPLAEDPTRQLDSFSQHPMGEARRELNAAHGACVSLSSLNCEPPPDVSHVAPQCVCKALRIELEVLQKQKNELLKLHEEKKLQTKMACEKEIEHIRKKYDVLLQNVESALQEEKGALEARCRKIQINKSLVEAARQCDTLETLTLAEVTTHRSLDEQFGQCARSRAVTPPSQVAKPVPAAEGPIQVSFGSRPEFLPTPPDPLTSSEMARCLQTPLASVGRNQPLPGLRTMGNLSPMVQIPPALVYSPANSTAAGYRARAPPPHLRHVWPSQPVTTRRRWSSPDAGIFSPVSLWPVTSHIPSLLSAVSNSQVFSPFPGLPLFER